MKVEEMIERNRRNMEEWLGFTEKDDERGNDM